MESITKGHFILKQIFTDNWERFMAINRSKITFSTAYNVWKVHETAGSREVSVMLPMPVLNILTKSLTYPKVQKSLLPGLCQNSSR
uniref:Uncharacterized protein n=1 Tax=Candidatus Kentrum sp. FW TaxID=2126338 RepID=A0A450ST86_9GAMM|nr:MAG: hypothetical protein BECKFW1821A_GA0114235_106818 [Candidatus Kentron sp. FW]